ncbi:M23 family metallopeptidase [Paenibacillus polysaccharolyticus]|uniref:M23 family metallopeptidase n=1 Tax=Paenibacillus polysaccharolyticus TaxID=582692 RepID=UPI00300B9E57
MIPISDEVLSVLSERLKLGEYALPNIRVEVDRLAFIPGRTEEFRHMVSEAVPIMNTQSAWVDETANGTYNGSTQASSQDICFPVKGKTMKTIKVSDHFGSPRDKGRSHRGIDLWDEIGTPILAAWSGKVVRISRSKTEGAGNAVNIRHAGGIITKYFHLKDIHCSVDDEVAQGDVIGTLGNTGGVYTNGHKVSAAERAAGRGRHLHFEIWEGVNPTTKTGEGGKAVNPQLYLEGKRKLHGNATTTFRDVTPIDVGGYPGEIKLNEKFDKRSWYEKSIYKTGLKFTDYAKIESGWTLSDSGGKLVYTFDKQQVVVEFEIDVTKLSMPTQGLLSIGLGTNFSGSEGDSFTVVIDGKTYAYVNSFSGAYDLTKLTELKNIVIPAKAKRIQIKVTYGGKPKNASSPDTSAASKNKYKKLAIDYIRIQELLPAPLKNKKAEEGLDPSQGYFQTHSYESFVMNNRPETDVIQVGSFVYMDTQVLPNIIAAEIDDVFDAEAREARLTISNPRGFFSPDYNPAYFPELEGTPSPWSYYANGFHVGVLSENTPIRIYMGYGQHMMRVFTGLIDKIDINGEDSTLEITARDMYKRVIEKVISEKKAYPEVDEIDNVPDPLPPAAIQTDRTSTIIQAAQVQAAAYGVPDHKFLLAICRHETVMGTQGRGREASGSFILGYGIPDKKYSGIQEQMKRGAERMSRALASKGKKVTSKADVLYFHRGGDIAPMTWSEDEDNWVNRVWAYYQEMLADPTSWSVTATSTASAAPTSPQPVEFEKAAWVKSTVVLDLIKHAGLVGWRATSEDRSYPDYVIDETYLVEVNQKTGRVIVPVPGQEGEFEVKDASTVLTPNGWLNPFTEEYGKTFEQWSAKVTEAVQEIISEIPYRSYCDRYGTYRLERINYDKPVVSEFSEYDNLISITKSTDWSRGRSHIVVVDANRGQSSFVDKEILLELKGEIRTMVLNVPWAKTTEAKRQVAERAFFDMKRMCRTLQVSIPANPALDLLDNVIVTDKTTTTRSIYTIKSIKTTYSVDRGMLQVIDLMWARKGVMV